MFEKLFTQRRALSRHREGPFAKDRESYLAHQAKDGAAPGTLVRHRAPWCVLLGKFSSSHNNWT